MSSAARANSWQAGSNGTQPDYTDDELREFTRIDMEYFKFDDQGYPDAMGADAFSGIAGEIIEAIAPQSEAAPEGILGQFLVGFGNIIGRGPCRKQAGTHHVNEFAVLVGETAFGRKGTAWDAAEDLFSILDQGWLSDRVRDGFQSGEAIVHAVRDPKISVCGKRQINDPGVTDKRLQIMEDEFGRFLSIAARQGNTLSSMTRKAWDGKNWLYIEGKIAPEKATGAHISLIGHVTKRELLKTIAEVEAQNGFSNRILWIATRRTKILPIPEPILWRKDHPGIVKRLQDVVLNLGNGTKRQLAWSADGKTAWNDFYRSLKSTSSGIIGSIVARSAAHILRLTMIYTLLDNVTLMQPIHLKAAIAFWQYCVQSAQWIFGEKTGNTAADRIYWALRRTPAGITRTEIVESIFSRNCPKIILDQALNELVKAELATMVVERTAEARKPIQRWFATKPE